MLEKMDAFFEARLNGYEAHMLSNIEGAEEFYPFTAAQLPDRPEAAVLDLGCGTGLELRWYYRRNPTARVTGIDLSEKMLAVLAQHYGEKAPTLIRGSYFEVPLGEGVFDAAVSVESLHHFTKEEKIGLYEKLRNSLRFGGYFILTDYFAASDAQEQQFRAELEAWKIAQGVQGLYHFDTPLTVQHEQEALLAAGFSRVEILGAWGATCCLKAVTE